MIRFTNVITHDVIFLLSTTKFLAVEFVAHHGFPWCGVKKISRWKVRQRPFRESSKSTFSAKIFFFDFLPRLIYKTPSLLYISSFLPLPHNLGFSYPDYRHISTSGFYPLPVITGEKHFPVSLYFSPRRFLHARGRQLALLYHFNMFV